MPTLLLASKRYLSFSIMSAMLLMVFNCQASSQISTINIGSYPTPGLIQENGKGLFNYLNRQIFTMIERPMKLSVKPLKRTKLEFEEGKVHAYFPELWEKLPGDKADYTISEPIFFKKVILFTRKPSTLTNLEDFKNNLLGLVAGYSYGKAIANRNDLNLSYQENDDTNIRLLANHRIDGVLGGFPSTVMSVNNSAHKHLIQYDLDKPVAVLESFYVCPNTAQGQNLCKDISKGIQKLKEIGALMINPVNGNSKFDPSILRGN